MPTSSLNADPYGPLIGRIQKPRLKFTPQGVVVFLICLAGGGIASISTMQWFPVEAAGTVGIFLMRAMREEETEKENG